MKYNPVLKEFAEEFYSEYLKRLNLATGNAEKLQVDILREYAQKLWNRFFGVSSNIPKILILDITKVLINEPDVLKNSFACYFPETIVISHKLINEEQKDLDWSYRILDSLAHELIHHKTHGRAGEFCNLGGHNEFWMYYAVWLGVDLEGTFQVFKGSEQLSEYIKQGWNPNDMCFAQWQSVHQRQLLRQGWNSLVAWLKTLDGIKYESVVWLRRKIRDCAKHNWKDNENWICETAHEARNYFSESIVRRILSLFEGTWFTAHQYSSLDEFECSSNDLHPDMYLPGLYEDFFRCMVGRINYFLNVA